MTKRSRRNSRAKSYNKIGSGQTAQSTNQMVVVSRFSRYDKIYLKFFINW